MTLLKWTRQVMMTLLIACGPAHGAYAQAPVILIHIHGLSYSSDGKRLMIPSHHGLAIYENGKWSKAAGPQHDYMGFSATSKGLYSSGHPAPGSNLVNPFGLIRSSDEGKTWVKLGLEGETDFHLLATSWSASAIYVWNPATNTRIRRAGLHSTVNDGSSWKSARTAGLEGEPHALAVHPDDPSIVAVSTSKGVFGSRDFGDTFRRVAEGESTRSFSISMVSVFGSVPSKVKRFFPTLTSTARRSSGSQSQSCKRTPSHTWHKIRRTVPSTQSRASSVASS